MFEKPDCTFEEVPAPPSRWCSSGHTTSETFRREGPGSEATPTRFFMMSSKDLSGTFCEPCLIVANWMAQLQKKGMSWKELAKR